MGCIGPTGLRPTFTQKLADYGIDLPGDLFGGTTFHEDELRAQGRRK